uniref:Uncharacterized protein n=1 Tax=Cucumis sativus TaxID=3659 RepID=A0A0A0KP08_CUCSA
MSCISPIASRYSNGTLQLTTIPISYCFSQSKSLNQEQPQPIPGSSMFLLEFCVEGTVKVLEVAT